MDPTEEVAEILPVEPKKIIPKTSYVQLWEQVQVVPLLTGIRLAPGTAEYVQYNSAPTSSHSQDHCASGLPLFQPSKPGSLVETRCPYCQVKFDCREEQVAHYHLDYHKANLKRSVAGKTSVTEEQFLNNTSDVSSISGSEDEEEEDELETDGNEKTLRKQKKVFFLNTDGEVISMFRAILEGKKCEISGETEMVQRALIAPRRLYWVIIVMGGGHFAAGVFKGDEAVIHKTFHSYTVRSKQGGAQSSRDNRNATSHPRSAGASLRRYNEQAHAQHIQELMDGWEEHLQKCNLVFLRVPNRSRSLIFGGRNPLLSSSDPRIRNVPFLTRRATFSEVKRIHAILTQIEVHGTEEVFIERMKEKEREMFIDRQVKREATPPRKTAPKPKRVSTRKTSKSEDGANDTADLNLGSSSDELTELITQQMTINTQCLKEFGTSFEDQDQWRQKKKKSPRKRKKSEGNKNGSNGEITREIHNLVYTSCKVGDIAMLEAIINCHNQQQSEDTDDNCSSCLSARILEHLQSSTTPLDIFSLKFGNCNKNLLHVAAENKQKDMIWWLLDQGCDPSSADKQEQIPYNLTQDKDTRNTFRRFMAMFPDKYDYKKANVPSPLTTEIEVAQAEKRRMQRKAKQEREKDKKKQNQEIKRMEAETQKEDLEKNRFLNLSDREKRALAADRRLLKQHNPPGTEALVLSRCFQCAADISGKVPFEYSNFKFCSTKCVREHRKK